MKNVDFHERVRMNYQVQSLHIYPVKSCGGIDLQEMKVLDRGPEWDRNWMIVDANNKFITQRQHPQMALIRTSLDTPNLKFEVQGHGSFLVPLNPSSPLAPAKSEVWSDTCDSLDEGEKVAQFLSDFLGLSCRLVRMAPNFKRLLPEKYNLPGTHTGFADGLPFLLTATASLDLLNSKLEQKIPMDRFRANIVLKTETPHEEDTWQTIQIGDIRFNVARFTSRCVITGIDQKTAQTSKEPLKTLATYRRDGTRVNFGQNLIHLNQGTLRIDDKLSIIEKK